jgi:hypothetical protein
MGLPLMVWDLVRYAAILAVIAFVGTVGVFAIHAASVEFDRQCVRGRISDHQARALNKLPWEKCPSYRRGMDGECLEVQRNDRVVNRECSEFMRGLTFRNILNNGITVRPKKSGIEVEVEF